MQKIDRITIEGKADFEKSVLNNDKPVIVVFIATWAGPYQQVMGIISKAVSQTNGKCILALVDVDIEEKYMYEKIKIKSVPTVCSFSKGLIGGDKVAEYDKNKIEAMILKYK